MNPRHFYSKINIEKPEAATAAASVSQTSPQGDKLMGPGLAEIALFLYRGISGSLLGYFYFKI